MTLSGNLLGPQPTLLPVDPAAAALDGGAEPAEVAAAHPTSSLVWAVLAERALEDGADASSAGAALGADASSAGAALGLTITGYAYARTGYHRGLDQLRRNGWKGFGPVPWSHVPNQGFLRALAALHRAADAIGETEEAQRTATFLVDSDPAAPVALGLV